MRRVLSPKGSKSSSISDSTHVTTLEGAQVPIASLEGRVNRCSILAVKEATGTALDIIKTAKAYRKTQSNPSKDGLLKRTASLLLLILQFFVGKTEESVPGYLKRGVGRLKTIFDEVLAKVKVVAHRLLPTGVLSGFFYEIENAELLKGCSALFDLATEEFQVMSNVESCLKGLASYLKLCVSQGDVWEDEIWDTLKQITETAKKRPEKQKSGHNHDILMSGRDSLSLLDATDLTGCWEKLIQSPSAIGGNSDVYKSRLIPGSHAHKEQLVAVKVLRNIRIRYDDLSTEILMKRLLREVRVWSRLNHRHVVPFLGFAFDREYPCMVAPWYENSNASDYLRRHPHIDRTQMITESIEGVVYLHSCDPPVVHGDLKASNVLVDNEGHARITDFGLSRNLLDGNTGFTTSSGIGGTHRWMAPELLNGDSLQPTTMSDVYALVLLALEIYTDKVPFAHLDQMKFFTAISTGESPHRSHYDPFDTSEEIWMVFENGWSFVPEQRPCASCLKDMLNEALAGAGWRSC